MVVVGKLTVGVGNVPTNGLRIPVTFDNANEKVVGTAVVKSVLVMGNAAMASKRLTGVVEVVPVVPVVPVVAVLPKIAFWNSPV